MNTACRIKLAAGKTTMSELTPIPLGRQLVQRAVDGRMLHCHGMCLPLHATYEHLKLLPAGLLLALQQPLQPLAVCQALLLQGFLLLHLPLVHARIESIELVGWG